MQAQRRVGVVLIGGMLLAGLWSMGLTRPAAASWPPGSTLYGANFRNNVNNTICSITITNWSDFATEVIVTPNGYSPITQTIQPKGSRIWLASIVPSGTETWVTAQSNNGASLTGTIRCRSTDATEDSLAVDEMIPASGPATIPFIPSTGEGQFVGAPQTGTVHRISDGANLGTVSGYSWTKPGLDEAYLRGNAAQVIRAYGSTAGGGRASMVALPDSYAGRTVVFPRVFKAAAQGSLVNLVNVGALSATVYLTAYEQGTSNFSAYTTPVILPPNRAVRIRMPEDWNPPFTAMSVVAEAQQTNARLLGSMLIYRGTTPWNPSAVTYMDLSSAPSGPRAFATLARATFRRQVPSTEGTAVVIMNTSRHDNVPIRVVLRNASGTILLNNAYTLNAFRRLAITLTDDITFPTGEYSVEAYPDDSVGTIALMAVGYESLPGPQKGGWAIAASVVSFDQTPPTCTANPAPSSAWISGQTSVVVTCTDNGSGIRGSDTFNFTLNANQGNQTVSGISCDLAGNCTNFVFSPYNRDSTPPTPPTLSLSGFSQGTWNPTTLSVGGSTDNLSGVASYQCSINGGGWDVCPTNVSTYTHGTTIVARAIDNAGNISGNGNTVTIQRDTIAPATAIGAITPEYRNTAPQLFYAPTSDGGSPFTTVRLLRRPSPTDPWTDSGPLTNGMSWTPPGQGRWYVASKVTDQAGNVEPEPTGPTDDATFFYDTIAPNAPTVLSVGPSNSRTPNVTWIASLDPGAPVTGSGVITYRVFILRPDNTLVTQYDVAAPTTNGNVNVSLPDGNYAARVVAIDRAGNQSAASANFPFSVDSASTFAGRVYSDTTPLGQFNGESGVPAVPVTLTQPTSVISTTTTNALGDYSFAGLETPGYYTVSVGTPAGYARTTPDQRRRLVVIGSDFTDIHFGMRYIGNLDTQLLWVDTQCEDGRPFPLAAFTVAGPGLNGTAVTDSSGGWAAEVSQAGIYTVTLTDTGLTLVPPGHMNPVTVTVPTGGSGGAAFVLACSNISSGQGAIVVRLYDADNPAGTPALFAGRTVTASNGISTLVGTTNAGGYVTFAGLVSGTWMVTAPVIGGQVLVNPGLQAYVQTVNVVTPLASQVRYGYRSQGSAVQTIKLGEDLTANSALYVGDVVRYTLVVTNNTGSTLTNVRITDTLPGGVSFGRIESVQPTGCSAGDNAGQVLATCPTLGAGQAMRIVFTATVTVAGQNLVNSFVWSADQFTGENPGGTCVNAPCGGPAPRARVDVPATAKQANVSTARMGEVVNYTIVVSNPSGANLSVTVTDTLAVSATLESATPGYSQSGQALVWANVVVPAGGTATLTVTVRAASGPLPSGYVLNNAVVILSDGVEVSRNAPGVQILPWRAYVPIARRP